MGKHKEIQCFLQTLGHIVGFKTHTEYRTKHGRIDVVWGGKDRRFLFEIENKDQDYKIMRNLEKIAHLIDDSSEGIMVASSRDMFHRLIDLTNTMDEFKHIRVLAFPFWLDE